MCQGVAPATGDLVHSKKPSAGIRQRVEANASLKAADVPTVSMRALNIACFGISLAYNGTSHQRPALSRDSG